ncbi:SUKH-3 domain-containing protein [Streptomyces caniferus]|uniref:SUKH-3 domain-containing protein n=1 Tax=Streptomyces caniferus TaxID=285557 RepID=UPI002E2BBF53|nr:SUKH-3 domain-containing protein [Streptomyces caniferus]
MLHAAGWKSGRDAGNDGMLAILETISTVAQSSPGQWVLFPAAEQSIREFHGLTFRPNVPGRRVAATGCTVDPRLGRYTHHTLAELGEALGLKLFPFGRTDSDALLAVDERARLFSVDHSGPWFLGPSPTEGITALLDGSRPERVVDESREWTLPPTAGEDAVADAVKTTMVLVSILNRHSVLSTETLRLRVREKGGFGSDPLDLEFPVRDGALDDIALRVTMDLRARLQAAGFDAFELSLMLAAARPRMDGRPASAESVAPRIDCVLVATDGCPRSLRVELRAPGGRLAFEQENVAAVQAEINKYADSRG